MSPAAVRVIIGCAIVAATLLVACGHGATPGSPLAQCFEGAAAVCGEILTYRASSERTTELEGVRVWLEELCAQQDGEACHELARAYAADLLGPADEALVERLEALGCDASHGPACTALAEILHRDIARFDALVDKACRLGDARGCLAQARVLATEVPADTGRIREVALRACHDLDPGSCDEAAELFDAAGSPLYDLALSAELYERACLAGDGLACRSVGVQYFDGLHSGRPDYATAARYFMLGCELEQPGSCNRMGILHEHGWLGAADAALAASFYERACEHPTHYQWGCLNLGSLYEMGNGVAHDPAHALTLFDKSCAKLADGCLRAPVQIGV